MGPREFLNRIPGVVRPLLAEPLQGFQWRQMWSLVQLHYGNPRVHYEIWLQRRTGRVEVGLHFEDEPEHNRHYLALLADQAEGIFAELGPTVELEEWTRSWTRIHQTYPLAPLEESFLRTLAQCLAQFMTVLQPLVEELVAPAPGGEPARGQRRR